MALLAELCLVVDNKEEPGRLATLTDVALAAESLRAVRDYPANREAVRVINAEMCARGTGRMRVAITEAGRRRDALRLLEERPLTVTLTALGFAHTQEGRGSYAHDIVAASGEVVFTGTSYDVLLWLRAGMPEGFEATL